MESELAHKRSEMAFVKEGLESLSHKKPKKVKLYKVMPKSHFNRAKNTHKRGHGESVEPGQLERHIKIDDMHLPTTNHSINYKKPQYRNRKGHGIKAKKSKPVFLTK